MKFETLILRGLFVACMVVCGLILAAMVTTRPAPVQLANSASVTALLTSAPTRCALPSVDEMLCVRVTG
ncbi:hypothetical protein ISP15_17195 [Dyella jejuensis]|uniref:Uncharacterized protein n=1 Tax=Dyella jejuensis TaxID=1432009 RepID=A0ABW8JQP1_9GAMM